MRGPRPLRYSAGPAMAAPLPSPLSRDDMQAELTKLLLHGYGSLTLKIHDHRITALDTTTRRLNARREAEAGAQVEEA
ncbi:MAG: hypothetical protein L0Z46_09070 [Nitrospiraceae bacterium]|nr:hypothetical protein [Nitrospiraceae bacterium]